eukprot:gene22897-34571_t
MCSVAQSMASDINPSDINPCMEPEKPEVPEPLKVVGKLDDIERLMSSDSPSGGPYLPT